MGRFVLGWQALEAVEESLGKILVINLDMIFTNMSEEERVSLQNYHSKWFVDYCINMMGKEDAIKLFNKNSSSNIHSD